MKGKDSKLWHVFFQIGIAIKALDGFLETAGGIAFLYISNQTIMHTVFSVTQHRLLQDPDDGIANHLRHTFEHLSTGNKIFAAVYLLGHGAIKLGLAVAVWRSILWAFPVTLVVLIGFIGYQAFRLIEHFSVGLCAFTVIDVIVVGLVYREYQRVKKEKKK